MAEVDLNSLVQEFLKNAVKRLNRRDFGPALQELRKAEKLDKENPVVLYNIGICYSGLENHGEAVVYFKKILSMSKAFVDIIEVRKLMAYSLIRIGDHDEALSYLDQCIDIARQDTTALNMKGYCLGKKGLFDDALEVYSEIIEIDPENYNAYNSLAYLLALQGKELNRAQNYAKRALAARPDNPAYLDTIGVLYLKKNQPDMAKNYFKKALAAAPHSIEIKNHINELLKINQ